jgi:FkbM family methyltransferase
MLELINRVYARFFSIGYLARLNKVFLEMCLRARGYNNFRDNKESGHTFFIEKILAPSNPRICIDIGANVGDYSLELLKKTRAKVFAFEPVPTTFERLRENLSSFQNRIVFENKGVGSANGILSIYYSPEASAHASFSNEIKAIDYINNDLKSDVEVVTLDSYCASHGMTDIDFIKIDTEGFESEVFQGAAETFKNIQPKFIEIEFNWHQLFKKTTLNYFSEQLPNYDVYQLTFDNWIQRDPKDPMTNIFYFSNFIFVRKT